MHTYMYITFICISYMYVYIQKCREILHIYVYKYYA